MKNSLSLCCTVLLLMICLQDASFGQKKAKDALLFKISKSSNPGGGVMGLRDNSENILLIYQSGRAACKSTRYDPRGKKIEGNKPKCFQLNKEKITSLTELAEQTDFLEAKSSYRFFDGGVDSGKSFSIIFYRETGEKQIHLTNPRQSTNDIPLPESVVKFLEEIAEIDKTMKAKTEK